MMRKHGWTWLSTLLAMLCGVAFGLFAGIAVVRAQAPATGQLMVTQPIGPSPQASVRGASGPAQ